jgi:hypothetical protein
MTNFNDTRDFPLTFPLSGVLDDQVIFVGNIAEETSGETGDYTTDFNNDQHRLYILVNSITTGGDIVITGDSVSETTGLKTADDTETITVDTTASQYYKTDKPWTKIKNVDVSDTTSINYDLGRIKFENLDNKKISITGYNLGFYAQGLAPDAGILIRKIQDDGGKKFSIVVIEDIGFDSELITSVITDGIRTGGDARGYSTSGYMPGDNQLFSLVQNDFETYFSSDENIIDGLTLDEGIIVSVVGSPTGGITNIDFITGRLFFRILRG